MNKKVRLLGKRKTDSSAKKRLRKLHTSEYTNSCFKKKKFALYSNEDTIDYDQKCHPLHLRMNSTSSSLKKKKISRKRMGEGKRRRESVNEKEKEKEKEKKEEKEKKRE